MKAYIIGYSLITSDSLISQDGSITKEEKGLLNIKRADVYFEKFSTFGRLSAPDKLAFSAGALALKNCDDLNADKTGIILFNREGSIERDQAYMESVAEGFPRPNLFPATLPSSPVAELAITFGLKGPDRIITATSNSVELAIENGLFLLKKDNCENILITIVEHSNNEENQCDYSGALLLSEKSKGPELQYNLKNRKKNESKFSTIIESLINKTNFSNQTININH